MTLFLKFTGAKTNESSVIEHSLNMFIKDPSLAYDLSSNVTGTDKVELESKNNKVVTLTIRPPIEVYIVGEIQIKPRNAWYIKCLSPLFANSSTSHRC